MGTGKGIHRPSASVSKFQDKNKIQNTPEVPYTCKLKRKVIYTNFDKLKSDVTCNNRILNK